MTESMASPAARGRLVLAIDQGTTSTRAILFSSSGAELGRFSREHTQHFPADGWVEHDADEIWSAVCACVEGALAAAGVRASDVASVGITNQRAWRAKRQDAAAKQQQLREREQPPPRLLLPYCLQAKRWWCGTR